MTPEEVIEKRDMVRDLYEPDTMQSVAWALTPEQRVAFIAILREELDKETAH